jgi:hypothetical protein
LHIQQDGRAAICQLQSYIAAAKATGWKVVVATTLQRGSGDCSGGSNAIILAFDALVRAGWNVPQSSGGLGADALADWQADPTIGPASAMSNAALYPDGIHLSSLGAGYAAQITAQAISGVMR